MQIDRRELGRHYASLNDEELLDLKRDDLTATAQHIYDLEIARRGLDQILVSKPKVEEIETSFSERDKRIEDGSSDPDWHHDGVVACAFSDREGQDSAERASKAQTALNAAGIQSHLRVTRELDAGGKPTKFHTLEVLVPVGLMLHAASILDRDCFNDYVESDWRDQLKILSDEDMLALDPDIFCTGLLDRVTRMKKVYAEEMAKRELKAQEI
jgi:hypothetical protein